MTYSMSATKQICYTGLFIAISLLLPNVFHLTGLPGTVLLPMHIGVLLCGFLVSPRAGFVCGLLAPPISSLLTGMPPAIILPGMMVELSMYGLISGILYQKTKKIYLSLVVALVFGRLINAIALFVLSLLFAQGIPPVVSVWAGFLAGIPGIVIQLILIPLLVTVLNKRNISNSTNQTL